MGSPGVGDVGQPATSGGGGGGGQSMSAHDNILASTIALHTPAPLSFRFTEESGVPSVKPKHRHVLSGY